jgi:hypothetical protein
VKHWQNKTEEIMTINEKLAKWAEKLNGREYCNEITAEESRELKSDGFVVAYGQSDDLLELSGAIDEELGAWDGCRVLLYNFGGEYGVYDEDENRIKLLFNSAQISKMKKLDAIWCPVDKDDKHWASWLIEPVDFPHLHFDIMEDGKLYCRGTIFSVKDMEE